MPFRNTLAGCTVTIHEHLDETVSIPFGPHTVGRFNAEGEPLGPVAKRERARNWNSPFPVSPFGGKPGREGAPHAGSTPRASKPRWLASMLPAPPTRGLTAPLCIACARARRSRAFVRTLRRKPDRSRVNKTGHLDLLTTDVRNALSLPRENVLLGPNRNVLLTRGRWGVGENRSSHDDPAGPRPAGSAEEGTEEAD
jgi:hypothetical protein